MPDQVDELTFAEAFAAVETRRPELEVTLLARHPELQVEEERFVDAQEAEAQDNFSRGFTTNERVLLPTSGVELGMARSLSVGPTPTILCVTRVKDTSHFMGGRYTWDG